MKHFSKDSQGTTDRVISVDPFRCRMWELHDRLEEYITENSCQQEIESFASHGQLVPVLGRPIRNDAHTDVELIYGARRLFVARHLNREIIVNLREISDLEAFVAMDVENRHRRDISAYERGLNYARWMRKGQFKSQDDIARTLHISPSQVSRLLKIARLPALVLSAFESPMDISEKWGPELFEAWEDPARHSKIATRARSMAAVFPRPPARQIYGFLIAPEHRARHDRTTNGEEIVRSATGVPLYRVKRLKKTITLALPTRNLEDSTLDDILLVVSSLLQRPKGGLLPSNRELASDVNGDIVDSPTTTLGNAVENSDLTPRHF